MTVTRTPRYMMIVYSTLNKRVSWYMAWSQRLSNAVFWIQALGPGGELITHTLAAKPQNRIPKP